MPLYNKKNKRGINFAKPAEKVKSKRYTVKFTESEYDRIMKVVKAFKLERMELSREAILKAVAVFECRLPNAGIQRTPEESNVDILPSVTSNTDIASPSLSSMADVERAIMLRYRRGDALSEIAASLDYPLAMVEAIVERLK